MRKSAHAGQDDPISPADHIGISGDSNFPGACRFQRIPDRLEVARAIIDQGEAHSIPLVEGMASALRASISTATRSARASDL